MHVSDLEVGREGGEDALVDRELGLLHLDPDVGEGVLAAEDVEAGQDHVGVGGALEHELLGIRDFGPGLDLRVLGAPVVRSRSSGDPDMS